MAHRFPNQGFAPNQGMPSRGMQGPVPNRRIQGPVPNRGMQGPVHDRGMQGPVPNRGMQDPLANRGMQGPVPNRGMQGPVPNRGMQDPLANRGMQGPVPNRGMHGPEPNRSIQGPVPNRGMQGPVPNRGLPGPEPNRGMQGPVPNRGMQGSVPNRGMQGPVSNRGMQGPEPNRGMQGPVPNRGMQISVPNRGVQGPLPNRGMPGLDINNQGLHNQGIPRGNIPMSPARPQVGMIQASGQLPVQQSVQFAGSHQGQPMGFQSGQVPASSMPQGPIVQHVMIPVPVPVGTEIPSHLLRPQIITSTGIPSQGHFTGPQGQSHFPEMQSQGQFQNLQGNFSNMQGQGSLQGPCQSPSMQPQSNYSSGQFQGPGPEFLASSPNAPTKVSDTDRDDLSYYMDNESRNTNTGRSEENVHRYEDQRLKQSHFIPEEVYARTGKTEEYKHRNYDRKLQIQQRIEQEQEYERQQRERSRSQDSSNLSYASGHTERSRKEQYSNSSHFSDNQRQHNSSLRVHEELRRQTVHKHFERFDTKSHEHVDHFSRHGDFERNERPDRNADYDSEHNSGRHREYERVGRIDDFERNQGSSRETQFEIRESFRRQGEFERHGQYEKDQRYVKHKEIEMNQNFSEHGEFENEQREHKEWAYDSFRQYDERPNVDLRHEIKGRYEHDRQCEDNFDDLRNVNQISKNNYRDEQRLETEIHSNTVLYTDGKREDFETDLYTDGKREDLETVLYTDGKREDLETVLYTDGNREDLESRGIKRYDREDRRHERVDERGDIIKEEYDYGKEIGKRKLSPVSSERSSRKARRDYSPVSDSKSHGDLKIHVSDRGRWIETESNLSPVSGGAFESDRHGDERHRMNETDKRDENTSLDGAEMISDSESCIGDDYNDVRTHKNDLSPVSQQSIKVESQRLDDRAEYNKFKQEAERLSPNRSQHSRHSDDRSHHSNIRSHQTRHSEDRQKGSTHSSGGYEPRGHFPEPKIQPLERKLKEFQLRVPDLCQAHNQKGCSWHNCANLHMCKFFMIDFCKFGTYCTKGHDFFKGQPYDTLSEINPGFKNSNVTAEQIKLILKNRISSIRVPADLQQRLTTYKSDSYEKEKVTKNDAQNVVAADPTFDARNYAPGSSFEFKATEDDKTKSQSAKKSIKKKNESTHEKKNTDDKAKKGNVKENSSNKSSTRSSKLDKNNQIKQKANDSEKDKSKNRKQKGSNKNKKKTDKANKTMKPIKIEESRHENMLSPISGDEDDWEKYEKYENISEDGMSEKDQKDDLDNVSSDDSSIEQVQVNRSVANFPLPTPENIAVPIGMNDPLVFNRPLKNNPQSYIGPLNRPPPMFPIATDSNRPLFPVVNQGVQPANIGSSMQGLALGVPGVVPSSVQNHLPSPEFMQHVIQNLPKIKVEPTEQKNVFKNDNNPSVIETESLKKKSKSDKVERDPELKETIKKLWKFPHKGIVNMSIIEFVTETEAYKEEFIAEIIKVLVTLELPYVTMKKLLSVIKDKVSINVKSEIDLRKILEMYPNNFKIIETVDSDDESDDTGSRKNVQIKANIGLGFCEKHGFLPFAIGKCECNALHLCKFYFLSDCSSKLCKFGHKLKTEHNIAVLRQHKLHRLTGEEILNFFADIDNRNKETIPNVCKYYIREKGCYKGDNTEYDTICHSLHLCSYIVKGKCMNRECDRSHSIHDKQPLSLLQKYGLDPDELGDETVLQILGERALESEKDKGKKILSNKQSQYAKGRSSNVSGRAFVNKQGKTSTPAEGLTILTHSETRISSKYFVQNFKAPSICKFYQNEMGCRKKDWGSEGKCFFLHICQHFVNGDCKFGTKCKRSHDLFTGQAAEILEKYNFDLENLTASDILKRLNSNSGAPVELPKAGDKEKVEITIECGGQADELDGSKFEIPKHAMEVETRINVEENNRLTCDTERKSKESRGTNAQKSVKQNTRSYNSCNIEDVIKHIMEHNKVEEK